MGNKKYSKPGKPYEKQRIDEEDILVEKYGLKNKREIWKAEAAVTRIRSLAKKLITKSDEEKNEFVKRLQERGLNVKSIADALGLNKEDWLKRRLQTIVFAKGLAQTPNQARQFIVHKHVSIGNQVVNIPSYQVSLDEEHSVKLNVVMKILEPRKSKEKQIKEEILENAESVEIENE